MTRAAWLTGLVLMVINVLAANVYGCQIGDIRLDGSGNGNVVESHTGTQTVAETRTDSGRALTLFLQQKCVACHDRDARVVTGFNVHDVMREGNDFLKSGTPSNSLLKERIGSGEMPPRATGEMPPPRANPLTSLERNWIASSLDGGLDSPVEYVVTVLGGYGFRLPTEAEFEYAARGPSQAGQAGEYCFGNDIAMLSHYAWTDENATKGVRERPVRQKKANDFGLSDMHGNVAEWCQDWYGPYPNDGRLSKDPQGPANGEYRVVRGGNYFYRAGHARSACRILRRQPYYAAYSIGFRVAQNQQETKPKTFGERVKPMPTGTQDDSIVSVARQLNLTKVLEWADIAGVKDEIENHAGPFTVFAPTNEAIQKLGGQKIAWVEANPPKLKNLLLYHTAPGNLDSKKLAKLSQIFTLYAAFLPYRSGREARWIKDAQIIQPDVRFDKGTIHVIDKVLVPDAFFPREIEIRPEPHLEPHGTLMMEIPGGHFDMGSANPPPGCEDEVSHRVELSSFRICQNEVTKSQYEKVMGVRPPIRHLGIRKHPPADEPVTCISWYDAIIYCNRLSEEAGYPPYYQLRVVPQKDG